MKLAIASGRPPRELKQVWSSSEAAELYAADRCGLLPDPWLMLGLICCVIVGGDAKPKDFIPKWVYDDGTV